MIRTRGQALVLLHWAQEKAAKKLAKEPFVQPSTRESAVIMRAGEGYSIGQN